MSNSLKTCFDNRDISHVLRAAIFDAILGRKDTVSVLVWYLGGCFRFEVGRDTCEVEAYPWFRQGDYERITETLKTAIPSWRKIEDEIYEDKQIYTEQLNSL